MDDGDRSVVSVNGAYLPCLDQGEVKTITESIWLS